MELLQLRYFCDAAETENFSHTAHRYRIPPSAVSQTVKRLEGELGASLFDRTANRIRLNENGKLLYAKARQALSLLEYAEREIRDGQQEICGELRLLVCTNRRLLTAAIEEFREHYPAVTFLLDHRVRDSYDRYDLVIADETELPDTWEKQLLVVEDVLLAAERSHPLARAQRVSLADLRGASFVSMNEDSSLYRTTRRICLAEGFEPTVTIQCDDPHSVRQYVSLNLGITLFPAVSWAEQFPENVVVRPVGAYQRSTYVYRKRNGYRSRATEEFLACLMRQRQIGCEKNGKSNF